MRQASEKNRFASMKKIESDARAHQSAEMERQVLTSHLFIATHGVLG
jgi:hypothetical protein